MAQWYLYVPFVCGALAAIICASRQQWSIAIAMGCIAAFALFDNLIPNVMAAPFRYALFVAGAGLIAIDLARVYKGYKKSLPR
jgi:hypothetical protein